MKISGVMLFPLFLMLSGANSQLPSGSGPYRTAGISLSSATTQGQVVVILVPDLTEVVAEIADAVAKARGGAMAVPVESVFASTTDMSDQLIDYLVTKGGMEDAAMYPVIGLGGAAEHAIRLAYEDWV